MKIVVVGVGRAGGRITDAFLGVDQWPGGDPIESAFAVDTSKAYLQELSTVPEENQLLIGKDRAKGHGVGADNELAAVIAEDSRETLLETIDETVLDRADAVVVAAGLGGGTGSGAAPVIAEQLSAAYSTPVLGLGVFPDRREGDLYTLNAVRSYHEFVETAEHLFLFDNDAWRQDEVPDDEYYEELNEALVTPIGVLFAAADSSLDRDDESDATRLSEVLEDGDVSTIGYAVRFVEGEDTDRGFFARLWRSSNETVCPDKKAERAGTITALSRNAIEGRFTFPYDISRGADASLAIAGPPEYLEDEYLDRCCRSVAGRYAGIDVRSCDTAPVEDDNTIAAVVLLTGISEADRLRELTERGIQLQAKASSLGDDTDESVPDLVESGGVQDGSTTEDGREDIQPLF